MLDQIFLWLFQNWEKIGVGILLVVILYGGSRPDPWWVFGREFREEQADKEEWKSIAIRGTTLAEKGTIIAEKAVRTNNKKKAKS